jgi:drug/metabolite transporter (DMT)-like permease
MKVISPTAVSVIMPFSAVVTSILSCLFGMDSLSKNLLIGGSLCLVSLLISSFADIIEFRKKEKSSN